MQAMNQKTLKKTLTFEGIGLHTGKTSKISILPAEPKTGIIFQVKTPKGLTEIKADLRYAEHSVRCTYLEKDGVSILTVEHLLSALAGLGIDNAIIELDGDEIPILDGSASAFVDAIKKVGIQEQEEPVAFFEIDELLHFVDDETGSEYYVKPNDKPYYEVSIDFESRDIDFQSARFELGQDYTKDISKARTFVQLKEIAPLLKRGFIKGGSLKNALIIAEEEINESTIEQLKKKYDLEDVEVDLSDLGLNQMLFPNEPARHKLLDFIGDMSLLGKPLNAKLIAKKPGHKSNIAFAKFLRDHLLEKKRLKGIPIYDPNEPPLYDVEGIKKMIPHRYPFLFVDKIIKLTETEVVGIKNSSYSEAFFQGHFPGNPIFPGVIQMEALAQTGGILALNTVPDPENWDTLFLKMDNVKFKHIVRPGDVLIFKMVLLSPVRRGIFHMQGTCYVNNKIASEGELTAKIVKRES